MPLKKSQMTCSECGNNIPPQAALSSGKCAFCRGDVDAEDIIDAIKDLQHEMNGGEWR